MAFAAALALGVAADFRGLAGAADGRHESSAPRCSRMASLMPVVSLLRSPATSNPPAARSAKGQAEPVHFRKQFDQADGHTFPLGQCGKVNPSLRIARLRWAP